MKSVLSLLSVILLCACSKTIKEKKFFSQDDELLPNGYYFIDSEDDDFTRREKSILEMAGVDLLASASIKSLQSSQTKDNYYLRSHSNFVFSVVYKEIEQEGDQVGGRNSFTYEYYTHKIHSNCGIQGGKSCILDENATKFNRFNHVTILKENRLPKILGQDSLLFVINQSPQTIGIKGHIGSRKIYNHENQIVQHNTPIILTSGSCKDGNDNYTWAIGYIEYDLSFRYNFDNFFEDDKLKTMCAFGIQPELHDKMAPSLLNYTENLASN